MRSPIKIIVLVNTLLLILLVFLYPGSMIQPGDVIAAHQELEGDCFACHNLVFGISSAKCRQCHQISDIGLRTTTGIDIIESSSQISFHQGLLQDNCIACHSDHKGVQAYRPTGHFSHELIATDLQERCSDCHTVPQDSLHETLPGECAECHGTKSWQPADFDHTPYFRFDKQHDDTCASCHINNNYSGYTCFGCHEHSPSNIRHEHLEEGIRDFDNCVECHRSGDEHEAEYIWEMKKKGYSPANNRRESSAYRRYERKQYREYREHDDDDDD